MSLVSDKLFRIESSVTRSAHCSDLAIEGGWLTLVISVNMSTQKSFLEDRPVALFLLRKVLIFPQRWKGSEYTKIVSICGKSQEPIKIPFCL